MTQNIQEQLVAMEERLRLAMLRSDVEILDELIAPNLVFTTHLGQVIRKQDDLAAHKSGAFQFKELTPSEQEIQLHEGFAIVSVLMHLVGRFNDAPFDSHIRYTRVWSVSQNAPMQILAGHASAVAAYANQ